MPPSLPWRSWRRRRSTSRPLRSRSGPPRRSAPRRSPSSWDAWWPWSSPSRHGRAYSRGSGRPSESRSCSSRAWSARWLRCCVRWAPSSRRCPPSWRAGPRPSRCGSCCAGAPARWRRWARSRSARPCPRSPRGPMRSRSLPRRRDPRTCGSSTDAGSFSVRAGSSSSARQHSRAHAGCRIARARWSRAPRPCSRPRPSRSPPYPRLRRRPCRE